MITETQNNNFIDSQITMVSISFSLLHIYEAIVSRFQLSLLITLWIIYPVNYMLFFVRGCILTLVFYFIFE